MSKGFSKIIHIIGPFFTKKAPVLNDQLEHEPLLLFRYGIT